MWGVPCGKGGAAAQDVVAGGEGGGGKQLRAKCWLKGRRFAAGGAQSKFLVDMDVAARKFVSNSFGQHPHSTSVTVVGVQKLSWNKHARRSAVQVQAHACVHVTCLPPSGPRRSRTTERLTSVARCGNGGFAQ